MEEGKGEGEIAPLILISSKTLSLPRSAATWQSRRPRNDRKGTNPKCYNHQYGLLFTKTEPTAKQRSGRPVKAHAAQLPGAIRTDPNHN